MLHRISSTQNQRDTKKKTHTHNQSGKPIPCPIVRDGAAIIAFEIKITRSDCVALITMSMRVSRENSHSNLNKQARAYEKKKELNK